MKYFDNMKQLEAFASDSHLDVLWPLEAVAIKGRREAYCPRCGKMYTHDFIGKYEVRRCAFCKQQFVLHKRRKVDYIETPKKTRFSILSINDFLKRRRI